MGWPVVPLREVVRLDLDSVAVDPTESYETVGVYSFGRGLFNRRPVLGSESSYKKFYRLGAEHFVLSLLFGWEGALSFVGKRFVGKYVSPYFPTFRCDPKRLDVKYLDWFTKRPSVWEALKTQSSGLGDRRRTLKPDHLLSISIPLPPLDEQQHIVAKLDKVAALVGGRRKVIEIAQQDAKAMLANAFRKIIADAPSRPMAEVAPLVRRPVEIEPDQSYPELGVRSFGRGTFHKPPLVGSQLTWQKLFLIQKGDLVFSNIKAWEGAFAVAQPEDHNRVGSHRYLTCVPVEGGTTASFIWFYLQSKEGLEKVAAASPGSADRNRTFGQKALGAIKVPVPPLDRQRWFDRLQMQVQQVEALRESAGQDVEALLPAMLHRVFNDEDASILGSDLSVGE